MIYFDNASTTVPYKEVLDIFNKESINNFANPSSLHALGMKNDFNILKIKNNILKLFKLSLNTYDIVFTSGATESNNLALRGYCYLNKNKGKHIISTSIEHESILNPLKKIEQEGFKVTYLKVNRDGLIDLNEFKNAITNETILVSIMGINNEVGNILNYDEIAKIIKNYPKCKFHSDLVQAIGKENINYSNFDMFTLTSHKIHGLKGVGALVFKKNVRIEPIIYGGEQQNNLRSGTIDYPNIAAFYEALNITLRNQEKNHLKVKMLHDYLYDELLKINEIELNSKKDWSPYIISFSLKNKKASVLIEALSNEEIYVNGVSACNSKKNEPSYVLKTFNKSDFLALNSIRVSLSEFNTLDEGKIFIEKLIKNINILKG